MKPVKKYYTNEFGIKRSAILCRLTYPKSSQSALGQKCLQQVKKRGILQNFVNFCAVLRLLLTEK